MNHETVVKLYRDGVEAIGTITTSLDGNGWARPACGAWNATDTARHLLGVVRWYDTWLDRALDGVTSPPFPESEIDGRNSKNVSAIANLDGFAAIAKFENEALAYLDRAIDHWGLPYAYPYGLVTVGLHLGVAATEWHLHAFDLSFAGGQTYEPRNAAALFYVAGLCVAETKPPMQRAVLRRLVPLGARSKPWRRILRESGRTFRPAPHGRAETEV